ncbi:MAG: hypothetical protein AB1696_08725 [Planctomycetota bacterium]
MNPNTIRRTIGPALMALVMMAKGDCVADDDAWHSPYDRAVELHPRGDHALKKKLLDEVRKRNLRLQVAFNAVLLAQNHAKHLGLLDSPQAALAEVDPGSSSLLGKKVVQVAPQANAQAMNLLESAGCDNKDVRVIASFFVRVLDAQRVELKLCPDRTFQSLGGASPTEGAPAMTVVFRPVVSPDGKRIRFDFFDGPNSVHAFEPRSLAATMTWVYPGKDNVALGPPQFDFEEKATAFRNSVEVVEGDYILLSRMSAAGEREVEDSVPVVGRLPLLKQFLSKRRIEKLRAQIVLLLRPTFEGYGVGR